MLINYSILPHPGLNDFITRYTLSESLSDNITMSFPIYATYESCLYFTLGNLPEPNGADNNTETIRVSRVSLCGLLTHANGSIKLQGKTRGFIIEFKPNGINRLFCISAKEICNNYFPANDILGKAVEYFHEELLGAVHLRDMALLADKFLIGILKKMNQMYINDGISKISFLLLTTFNTVNITEYASLANMSMRNFERRFTEQVGTSPKLFCRLVRFNTAMQLKMAHPKKSWTEIAYECGYFDQMHFIKDFKEFTNQSPIMFFNANPDLMKESFDAIEHIV